MAIAPELQLDMPRLAQVLFEIHARIAEGRRGPSSRHLHRLSQLGSVVPGIGTGIGALAGGLLGLF
jgi:hypothetical protein